jgi:hypothetical protein
MSEYEQTSRSAPEDDVERLLARLEPVAPPPDLATRVLARTSRRGSPRWWLWVSLALGVGAVTAILAAISGYLTGQEFVRSGAYELMRLAVEEWDLVEAAPDEYALALAETVPWSGLLATLACILAAVAVTRPLLHTPDPPAAPASQPA